MAGTNLAAAARQPPAAISAQIIAEDLEEWPKDPLFQQKRVEATKDGKKQKWNFSSFLAPNEVLLKTMGKNLKSLTY